MALSFRLFGGSEFAMELPDLAYVAAFIWLAWSGARQAGGTLTALGGLVAVITLPLLVIQSSIADVDVIELFFLTGSVLLFWRCLEDGPNTARLLGAGALAGAAFLTRETAVFIVPFYGVLFLVGHRFDRRYYLWIVVGFLAVWGVELIYLWVMTGDPAYRLNIALHHDPTINRNIDLAGNVIVNPVIDPLLVLLINQEFMALFYFAIPLSIWLAFGRGIEPHLSHFARIIGLLALIWFICAGAVQTLLPLNPRYFMVTAALASLLAGMALAQLIMSGGRVAIVAGAALAILVATNLAGIYVENKVPAFGEHVLARIASAYPGSIIHTDPMTRYRAEYLLRWEHARNRVLGTQPQPGDLYFYDPSHADAANFKMPANEIPAFKPKPDWVVEARYSPPETWLARGLEVSGAATYLPAGVWRKLRYHYPTVVLYRVPSSSPPTPAQRDRT
jgi:4-amino-4-deoxy-L-arabinose transferase-like glycosyltransferase